MQVIDLRLYLKCLSSTGFFKHFASKNQLPGFYLSGTLVENGLKNFYNNMIEDETKAPFANKNISIKFLTGILNNYDIGN